MKKNIFFAIIFCIIIALILGIRTYNHVKEYRVQKEIAEAVLRFHVRANSDSEADQALKLLVRDEVIIFLEEKLTSVETLDEVKNILYDCEDTIQQIALNRIRKEGYNYEVDVYFEKAYFPVKTYGDMVFPAGEYEALRVDIGRSEGRNWWCVLFPPLCFVDSTYAVVPEDTKDIFRNHMSDEAYSAITMTELDDSYEIRFKYLTFLNKLIGA